MATEEKTNVASDIEKRFLNIFGAVEKGVQEAYTPKEEMGNRYLRLIEDITQQDPNIDYSHDVKDKLFRAGFSRMDTPEERKQYLDKFVGDKNWGTDRYGNYILNPEGAKRFGINTDKPIPIDSPMAITKEDIADMAGVAPGMIGGTAGAISGTGYGAPVGILLAGAGTFLGKSIDEIVEQQQGYNLQPLPEVMKEAGEEALYSMGGESAARGLRFIGQKILGPHTRQPSAPNYGFGKLPPMETTVEPGRQQLVKEAMEMGAIPTIEQASNAKIAGRLQRTIHYILGDPLEEINRKAIRKQTIDLMRESGGEISKKIPYTTATTAGKGLSRKVQQTVNVARQAVELAEKNVTRQINKSLVSLRKTLGSSDPNINEKAVEIIKSSKDNFMDQAKIMYSTIDDMVGGQPIVSTDRMKSMALEMLEESPPAGKGRVFVSPESQSELNKIMQMGDFITLRQAQTMRTLLREAAYDPNMIKGFGKRQLARLKKSVDDSIMESGEYLPTRVSTIVDKDGLPLQVDIPVDEKVAQTAADLLKKADDFYKTNISKYDDMFIERVTRQAGKPGAIATEEFIDKLTNIKDIGRINNIKKLVGDDSWRKIRRQYFENILLPYTDEGWNINARQAFNKINQSKNFKAIFGEQSEEIKSTLREIAARNGKVKIETLKPDSNIVIALKETLTRQKELDRLMSIDFFKKIDQGKLADEQIVDYIFRPNNKTLIKQTKQFLGENSPEWLRLRQRAMFKIVNNMADNLSDPTRELLNGVKFAKAMEDFGYNSNVADNPVTEMFGKDLADRLYRFTKITQLLTQKQKGFAGALVAASIALHPLKNVTKLIKYKIIANFLASPKGVNYFIEGAKLPKTRAAANAMTQAMMQIVSQIEENVKAPEEQQKAVSP